MHLTSALNWSVKGAVNCWSAHTRGGTTPQAQAMCKKSKKEKKILFGVANNIRKRTQNDRKNWVESKQDWILWRSLVVSVPRSESVPNCSIGATWVRGRDEKVDRLRSSSSFAQPLRLLSMVWVDPSLKSRLSKERDWLSRHQCRAREPFRWENKLDIHAVRMN